MRVIAGSQPLDERQHVAVSPHPRGEAAEVREGGVGVRVVRQAHDVAIHPIGVGPVRFHRDRGEAALVDQPPGDARPLPVEVVRAVRGLADQDDAAVTDEIQQPVVVVRLSRDRVLVLLGDAPH